MPFRAFPVATAKPASLPACHYISALVKNMFYLCGVDPPSPLQIHDTTAFLLLNYLSFRSFFCFPSFNWSGKVKLLVAASPHHLRFPPSFCHPAIESLRDIASNIKYQKQTRPLSLSKTTSRSFHSSLLLLFFSSSHEKNVHNSHFCRCSGFPCFTNQQCLSCRRLSKNLCCWEQVLHR